ncbi:MAG: hypothetical protein LWY06_04325, partial [Firmicutes bacterium]|nr:hypothetical protein [Bacillota bacterium]
GYYCFMELAYFGGYQGMPHLFCTECPRYIPQTGLEEKNSILDDVYTEVFEWNAKKSTYVHLKTIKYKNRDQYNKRFIIKGNKIPYFTPHMWHLGPSHG